MAHVPLAVNHALSEFFNQWYAELSPKLMVKTQQNGDVVISSTLIASADQHANSFHHPWASNQRKLSGKNSRQRRQAKRRQTRSDETSSSSLNSGHSSSQLGVISDPNSCTQKVAQTSPVSPSKPCLVSTGVQASCAFVNVACETDDFPSPKEPVLSIVKCAPTSIPPREIFHPAIINACMAICHKHPSKLTKEEAQKFKFYLARKNEMGQPVESDLVYLPSSIRNCLHCGHLT